MGRPRVKKDQKFLDRKYRDSVFGDRNQLLVSGEGYWRNNKTKIYFVKCVICAEDSELFGDGVFESRIHCLKLGKYPCGCSNSYVWSAEQMKILLKRTLGEDHIFIDWLNGEYKGQETKCLILCCKHGISCSSSVTKIWNAKKKGCTPCALENIGASLRKPDEYFINNFRQSNSFSSLTTFERIEYNGKNDYWKVYCDECDTEYISSYGSLYQGCRGCACSNYRQKQFYVNIIYDKDLAIALKFGIANDYKARVKVQDRKSIYSVAPHLLVTFPEYGQAISLERIVRNSLDTGVLSKEEMPDGWEETTWVYNLEEILKLVDTLPYNITLDRF